MKWVKVIGGGLVALVGTALLALFAMSRRADAGRMHTVIDVARPPAEVRRWFVEPEKLPQWVSWLVEVKPVGATPSGPGSQQEWFMQDPRDGGKRSSFVRTLAAEDDSSLTITVGMPAMFDGRSTATFRALPGGGTQLVSESRFTYASLFWQLMEPLVTPEAQKKETEDYARLKAKIEASPAPPATVATSPAAPAAPAAR
jgi:uncharacterized protein YndB with AHSA1/START domain